MSAPSQAHENGTPEAASAPESTGLLDQVIQKTELTIDALTSGAMSALTRAEIDIQISTAKHYPRSLRTFLSRAMTMATLDQETAASCIYSLPRGKEKGGQAKFITGPSIRLAEIIASAWGNLRMAARLVGDDAKFITAQGMCHDLEVNNAITMDVQRRITYKNGGRYNDDMVGVTGNAAASIALRNAILRVIPRSYTNAVYEAARKVAVGDAKTMTQRRAEWVTYFGKLGISPERIAGAVAKASVEDIGQEELLVLRGIANAIKDGTLDIDEAFSESKADSATRTAEVKNRLAGKPEPPAPQPRPETATSQPQVTAPEQPERQPGDDSDEDAVDLFKQKIKECQLRDLPSIREEIRTSALPEGFKVPLLKLTDERERAGGQESPPKSPSKPKKMQEPIF